MNGILIFLALVGVIFLIIGRLIVVRRAREISGWWVLSIWFLPLGDLMFLARYWDLAKSGATLAIIGLFMIAPFGVVTIYEAQSRVHDGAKTHRIGMDRIDEATMEYGETERVMLIQAKEAKLKALKARMLEWYLSLQSRRAALPAEAEDQITAFNEEAAAYQSLLSISKEETAELESMKGRR